ncbi:MAG: hypothetical protein WAW17_26235 [Rhodococcus sp. (in: high G+C Gram-positive bacteria)]|uniref:hypothetical protein n=1 Tax=Rhodococcus sp. TaxID=1831 RepID=UPI003BAEB719
MYDTASPDNPFGERCTTLDETTDPVPDDATFSSSQPPQDVHAAVNDGSRLSQFVQRGITSSSRLGSEGS